MLSKMRPFLAVKFDQEKGKRLTTAEQVTILHAILCYDAWDVR